jgi:hypothetical protein
MGNERSFGTIKREGVQGLIVGTVPLLLEHRDQIVQFAARERLPVVCGRRAHVDACGLLSYSVEVEFPYIRGANLAQRILLGAKPAYMLRYLRRAPKTPPLPGDEKPR